MSTRILFFGTSEFAVPVLEYLAANPSYTMVGVVTQPDAPAGRHAKMTPSPIKMLALTFRLPLFQFASLKDQNATQTIASIKPDLAIVASYGKIIPQEIINLAPLGFLNVHASLLPAYRGASPIAEAIKNGDLKTGVTIMKMDAQMDHGPILATRTEPIKETDTTGSLTPRLARMGAELLLETLPGYLNGSITPQEQHHDQTTACKPLKRTNGRLYWTMSAQTLERLIRAYDPWPGAYTIVNGRRLKILRAAVGPNTDLPPGSFFLSENIPAYACSNQTSLLLLEVQPEGRRPMTGQAWVHGHRQEE